MGIVDICLWALFVYLILLGAGVIGLMAGDVNGLFCSNREHVISTRILSVWWMPFKTVEFLVNIIFSPKSRKSAKEDFVAIIKRLKVILGIEE